MLTNRQTFVCSILVLLLAALAAGEAAAECRRLSGTASSADQGFFDQPLVLCEDIDNDGFAGNGDSERLRVFRGATVRDRAFLGPSAGPGLPCPRGATMAMATGDDVVLLDRTAEIDASICATALSGGTGDDRFTVNGLVINTGGDGIDVGPGDDEVTVEGAVSAGLSAIEAGDGSDLITLNSGNLRSGRTAVNGGGGVDVFTVEDSSIRGRVGIAGGDDGDDFDLTGGRVVARETGLSGGSGGDRFLLTGAEVKAGGRGVDGGPGSDRIKITEGSKIDLLLGDNRVAGISGGSGADTICILGSSVLNGGGRAVAGESGDDFFLVRADSTVEGNIDGGGGRDTLRFLVETAAQQTAVQAKVVAADTVTLGAKTFSWTGIERLEAVIGSSCLPTIALLPPDLIDPLPPFLGDRLPGGGLRLPDRPAVGPGVLTVPEGTRTRTLEPPR